MFWTNRSLSHSLIMKAAYITNKTPAYSPGMAAVSLSNENIWAQSEIKWWQVRVELFSLRGWIILFFIFPQHSLFTGTSLCTELCGSLWGFWECRQQDVPDWWFWSQNSEALTMSSQLWHCCLLGLLSIYIILQQAVNPSASCCPGV